MKRLWWKFKCLMGAHGGGRLQPCGVVYKCDRCGKFVTL